MAQHESRIFGDGCPLTIWMLCNIGVVVFPDDTYHASVLTHMPAIESPYYTPGE